MALNRLGRISITKEFVHGEAFKHLWDMFRSIKSIPVEWRPATYGYEVLIHSPDLPELDHGQEIPQFYVRVHSSRIPTSDMASLKETHTYELIPCDPVTKLIY